MVLDLYKFLLRNSEIYRKRKRKIGKKNGKEKKYVMFFIFYIKEKAGKNNVRARNK